MKFMEKIRGKKKGKADPSAPQNSSLRPSSRQKQKPSSLKQNPSLSQPKTTTGINEHGNRVTTTTLRIPPSSTNTAADPERQGPSESRDDECTTTQLTRDLVKKFIADIWNRGEIDLIPSVCSPSLRFNGNTGFDRVGHDGLSRMVATIREALEDYHCEIHSMVVEGNKAFCRLRFTGKHNGFLLGYAPTGSAVAWMGATEFTVQNGKILKVWELGDVKSLEEQLDGGSGSSRGTNTGEV